METSPMNIDPLPINEPMNAENASKLLEEMRSEDLNIRTQSVEQLDKISLLLNEETILSHLFPYVNELLDDEEDSVLCIIAEKIFFISQDKSKEVKQAAIESLEKLLSSEDLKVREKSIDSINNICFTLTDKEIKDFIQPLFIKLTKSEYYSCRMCSSYIMITLFNGKNGSRNTEISESDITELTNIYWNLIKDSITLVRLEAVKNLPLLVRKLESQFLIQNLVPKLDELILEEQDSIRYLLVDLLVSLSQQINNKKLSEDKLTPVFLKLGKDPSWRVRYLVANKYVEFCSTLNDEFVKRNLIDLFVDLVKDREAEVRASIGQQIAGFGNLIGNELALKHLSNCISLLMEDSCSQVREKLAGYVTLLAPVFGKEKTIDCLLPVFVKLLKDEIPEVRLKLISRLEQVNLVIGVQILAENLLPAILELADDSNWRIRLAVIDEIPALAQHLGKDFFGEKLSMVCCQNWLTDKVCAVREEAIKTFPYLIEHFGNEWTKTYLLTQLKQLVLSENYLFRLTAIKACSIILPCLNDKALFNEVWENFFILLNDTVPNVKFNVCKALLDLSLNFNWLSKPDLVDAQIMAKIKDHFIELVKDPDPDVQYFSKLAQSKFD